MKSLCRIRLNQKPQIHFCEPGWSWKPFPLKDFDLWCVLGGKGRVGMREKFYPAGPGTCWVFAPGSQPEAAHHPESPLTVLAVHLDFLDREDRALSALQDLKTDGPIQLPDARRLQLLAQFMVGTNYRGEDGELAVRQLIHLLQHPEGQPADRVDARLQRVLRRVSERLAHRWTVAEMAKIACLSESRFTVLFRENLKQSPRQYVIAVRMKRAATLLSESDLPQAEIAEMLGFQDVYFFNRQFSKFHGKSPGRFRRLHRK